MTVEVNVYTNEDGNRVLVIRDAAERDGRGFVVPVRLSAVGGVDEGTVTAVKAAITECADGASGYGPDRHIGRLGVDLPAPQTEPPAGVYVAAADADPNDPANWTYLGEAAEGPTWTT